ncbi:MAG: GNAT family N-acetyltransferase [Rhodobacteraceae bacterium]|nr:GNAT family N-acetyltransferase [Paracoccaceae bacterium]
MADTLKTDRLTLRPLKDSDAGNIALFVGDPRVAMNLAVVPHPYPAGAAESYIAYSRAPETKETIWGMDKDGALIGMISISPKAGGIGHIGYWLAPQLWGGRLMSEALAAVVLHARKAGFNRLFASVHQGNEGSARLLMKCGFSYLGESETHSIPRDGMVAAWEYELDLRDG